MAGKRQHYLPRFLQKGFSSRQNGKEIYTWVFRQDNDPYETNIINVGAESYFYGDPDGTSIDENITEKELEFYPLLEKLRECSLDTKIEDRQINELIIHLVTRTRHIRLSLEEMGNSFLNIFRKYLCSPAKMNELILRYIAENPNILKNSIQKGFAENGINNIDPNMLELATQVALQKAPQLLRSPAFLGMQLGLIQGFKLLKNDMPKIVERSHLKALSRDIVPPSFLERIRDLQWMLLVKSPNSFILGDIGPLATKKTTREFKALFLLEDEDVFQVFLPISDSHIIMGSKDGTFDSYEAEIINHSSASFSKEFFIGKQVTSTFLDYKDLISTKSALFSEQELQEMERDLMQGLFEKLN